MSGAAGQKLRRSIFWTVGAALAALAAAATNPVLLVIALPIWAIAHRRIRRPEEMQASRATLGAMALVIFALLLLTLSLDPREFIEAFSMALAGLILIKLFDRVTARDQALLFCMSTSLVIGAALLFSSALIGLLLAVYLVLGLRTAALLQVALVEERAGRPDRGGSWRLARRGAAAAGVLASVVMVAVFVLMPRGLMTAPAMLAGQPQAAQNVSGFNDQIDLTRSGQIEESFEPVMEVEVLEGSRLGPISDRLYLRGAVLERYEGGLQRTRERDLSRLTARGDTWFLQQDEYEPAMRVRVDFLREEPSRRLFTMGVTHAIRVIDGAEVLFGDPATGEVVVESGSVRSYVLEASPLARASAEPPAMEAAFREGPVRELAVQLLEAQGLERDPEVRHAAQDERIVRSLERHLRNNYTYTTNPPPTPAGADPIADFLIENPTGHCERFATALAALSRAVGIEARVVTGYLTTERLDKRTFIVREAHAHAWVEAHVEPGLWLRFDASPPGRVAASHQVPKGPVAAIRNALRWANDVWVRNVVSFDRRAQSDLLGASYDTMLDRAIDKPLAVRSVGGLRGLLRSLAVGVGVFALTLLAGVALPKLAAWRRSRGASGRGALLREVRRADRALERAGLGRHPSVPMRAHAASLAAAHREPAEIYDRLAELRYMERFGGGGEPAASGAAELVERLRQSLRERGS